MCYLFGPPCILYLRVIEDGLTVVDAAANTVRQRPLAVDHRLVPRLAGTERRRVQTSAHRQTHEVPTEIVERHPVPRRHNHTHKSDNYALKT